LTFPYSPQSSTLFSPIQQCDLKLKMGITDFFSDLMASVGFQEAHAEAPAEDEDNKDEGGDEEKSKEGGEEGEEDAGGEDEGAEKEGGAEEQEEEEEEDDEPVDPKPRIEEGQSTPPLSIWLATTRPELFRNELALGPAKTDRSCLPQNAQDQPNVPPTSTTTRNASRESPA
jgi:hypothetical protein